MFPRTTATLLDSGATRFLTKYHVDFADLRTPDESALNKLLESQLPASVEQSLRDAGSQTDDAMRRVMKALPQLDPTLVGAAKTTLGKMEHELRSLHTKVIHAAKKRDDACAASSCARRHRRSRRGTPRNARSASSTS